MSTVDFATDDEGRWTLTPSGDLATVRGDAAVRARVLRSWETTPGTIPYYPDTGADAEQREGGPPIAADDLARAVLADARRDPDVIEASASQVVTSATGVTTVSARIRTRFSPDASQTLTARVPT